MNSQFTSRIELDAISKRILEEKTTLIFEISKLHQKELITHDNYFCCKTISKKKDERNKSIMI